MRNQFCAFALAACGATCAPPVTAQYLYQYKVSSVTAVDLGTFGGDESEATDVNNYGVIVGWAENSGTTRKAFRHDGSMHMVGDTNPQIPSYAAGVNDYSEVVGNYWDFFTARDQPFYWHSGTGLVTMSSSIQNGGSDFLTYPKALNNFGRIVGRGVPAPQGELIFSDACGEVFGLQWDYAYVAPQVLFCPGDGWSGWDFAVRATDVNDSGAIVGYEFDQASLVTQGFIWKNGVRNDVPGLTATGGVQPLGINASGKVVGRTAGSPRAFFWNGTSANATDLGALPGGSRSDAREINDANFVAGSSNTQVLGGAFSDLLKTRAFIWHVNFGMYRLPLPPGYPAFTTDCAANSLNNRNATTGVVRVVGYCLKNGKMRAVRWDVLVDKVFVPVGQL